jgi:hypothetical protein
MHDRVNKSATSIEQPVPGGPVMSTIGTEEPCANARTSRERAHGDNATFWTEHVVEISHAGWLGNGDATAERLGFTRNWVVCDERTGEFSPVAGDLTDYK